MEGLILEPEKWNEFVEFMKESPESYLVELSEQDIDFNVDHFLNNDIVCNLDAAEEVHFSLPTGGQDLSVIIDSRNDLHVGNSSGDKFKLFTIDLESTSSAFINELLEIVNSKENAKRFNG